MRNRALLFVLSVIGFVIAFATPKAAFATTNFPLALQTDLSLASAPQCALCHTSGDQGGLGTVNTPFGKSMRGLGLVAFDETSLRNALDSLTAQAIDSDDDCVDDVDELKQGTDPNVVDHPITCDAGAHVVVGSVLPRYGCGAHIAPVNQGASDGTALGAVAVGALGLAAILRERRRRRQLRASRR